MRAEDSTTPITVPARPAPERADSSKAAAADLVRSQLDALYSSQAAAEASATATVQATSSSRTATAPAAATPRTQQPQPATGNPHADHMRQYHAAWQSYYQKYYEQYYQGHLNKLLDERATLAAQPQAATSESNIITGSGDPQPSEAKKSDRQAALDELRHNLLGKVEQSARKVRKSRHFVPIAAALGVVLVFSFLQYNRILISNVQAYISPGSIDPQNIVVDPTAAVQVGPEPKLIIPKINVDVPAVYGVGNDNNSQMKAMESGVAHFAIPGASSVPGQIGNTILSGHSSNDLFDPGDYKFIFAQLDKLTTGDTIFTHYEGKRYSYVVTKKEVVLPTQVDKLIYATDKPILTLITCTPLGTAEKRLLITAEQVTPDPTAAAAAPSAEASGSNSGMPGNSPTFIERIFGS